MTTMLADVFHGVNAIRVEAVPKPSAGPGEAVIRVAMTTIIGISTHGHAGVERILLGSMAARVLRHAPCPVLAVR